MGHFSYHPSFRMRLMEGWAALGKMPHQPASPVQVDILLWGRRLNAGKLSLPT